MPTLEELLRDTLKGVNERHSQADGDLHRAVAEVARAIQTITQGRLTLSLRPASAVPNETVYELNLNYRGENTRLGLYMVPQTGFPIKVQPNPLDTLFGESEKTINSLRELEEHFKRMVSNPHSALVWQVAFAARQLEEDKRESEQATAG